MLLNGDDEGSSSGESGGQSGSVRGVSLGGVGSASAKGRGLGSENLWGHGAGARHAGTMNGGPLGAVLEGGAKNIGTIWSISTQTDNNNIYLGGCLRRWYSPGSRSAGRV